jgi:hypothetical protein
MMTEQWFTDRKAEVRAEIRKVSKADALLP